MRRDGDGMAERDMKAATGRCHGRTLMQCSFLKAGR